MPGDTELGVRSRGWENEEMLRDFLLLVLGLDGGLALPHIGTLASDVLTLSWSDFMSTLRTDMLGFVIEIILAFAVIWFLHRLTIPSVRSLRHYTCASCSIKYRATTSTTNIVNERTNIVAPPNSNFVSIKRQPTTLILYKINQKRN
jgi:hypothetical protein